jgi:PEP-CTERM motif
MRKAMKWVLLGAVGLVPAGANAATYAFDFSTTDSVFTATATITTPDTVDAIGGFDVLSISGAISGPNGGTIALEPNSSQPFPDYNGAFLYDNVFFPTATLEVDGNGILFSAGGYDYNLYSVGPTYYLSSTNPAGNFDLGEPVAFGDPAPTAAVAPEPSTWVLLLLGFAGLYFAGRRKAVLIAAPVGGGRRRKAASSMLDARRR